MIKKQQVQFFDSQMYYNNLNSITLKLFHRHAGIYRFRKKCKKDSREVNPSQVHRNIESIECVSLKLIVKDYGGNSQYVYHFVNPGLRIEIIFMKERTTENGGLILK